MKIETIFLVFCLTIVILGILTAPATADNTTIATTVPTAAPTTIATTVVTTLPTTIPTTVPTTAATTVAATTAATTVATTVATTAPTTVATTAAPLAPVAAFSATPSTGTAPLSVQFTDASTDLPTQWVWSFGDGIGNSTLENPSYTYANAGTYTVTLTAVNAAGGNICTHNNLITVSSITAATTVPVPAFSGTPTSGTAPLTVQFTDLSTGSPANWTWNFGDGNTSTVENPLYTYPDDGTYSVMLTATNAAGSNISIQSGFIVVGAAVPAAGFSASPSEGTTPLIVQFTDTSGGSPTSWIWDFGDGTTGSAQNPSHTYTTAGTYSVTQIVSNTAGSNTSVQSDLITVSGGTDVTTTETPEVTYTDSYTPAPTPVAVPAGTYAIPAATQTAADTSSSAWLAQENQKTAAMDTETPANASGLTPVISLIPLVCVALFFRQKRQ